MDNFIYSMLNMIPNIVWAIILLIIAFVAAYVVRTLVSKLLKIMKAVTLLEKFGVKGKSVAAAINFIEKLVYFITFILFLPGVLDKLGMESVSTPISGMMYTFLAFVPKLIATGIVIAIGFFVADIVKQLLVPALKAVKVDELQKKAGIESDKGTSLSEVIGYVVYGLIVLIVITSALDMLGIQAISAPANAIVGKIFNIVPDLLAAIVIVAVGVVIAKLAAKLLETLLEGVGADKLVEKITNDPSNNVAISKILGAIVKYVLIIIFVVQGINVLNLNALSVVGAAIIQYMPSVLVAVIILGLGIFAAKLAGDAIMKKCKDGKVAAMTAKVAIYVMTAFLCLSQLGVASTIVETAFVVIIAAVGVAFAIAFGVGGRQFAANMLAKLEKKIDGDK